MKVLLAIDDSPCSEAAVEAVVAHHRSTYTEVRVFHAVEWPKELPPFLAFGEGKSAVADVLALRDKTFDDADALVARAAKRLRAAGFEATTSVEAGAAKTAILDCAAAWHPDLIVMGSHGRRGLDRLFLGSVAESVARHARCSIEIVRPPADLKAVA